MPTSLICFQVINIINAAQENSPITVAEALDRVLEILRTTELYSPQLGTKDEDPHTSDLVGGLMNVSKISKDEIAATSVLHHNLVLCCAKISQAMGRGLVIHHHFSEVFWPLYSSNAGCSKLWPLLSPLGAFIPSEQKLYRISQKIMKEILQGNSRSLQRFGGITL